MVHKQANPHHSILNPPKLITNPPISGASICAADHDMLYKAAYCPLLLSDVRLTQNAFINGMESISATVITITMAMPATSPGDRLLSITKSTAASATPR